MDSDTTAKTCLEDGSWSSEEMSCVPRKCTLQTNTIKLKADYDINKTITVDCKPGYTLSGPSTSTCMVNCFNVQNNMKKNVLLLITSIKCINVNICELNQNLIFVHYTSVIVFCCIILHPYKQS